MTVTAEHDDAHGEAASLSAEAEHGGGHHETPEQRDHKERIALWLLIFGDVVFLALEIFTWFYLRGLNTNGMWRGALCTAAKPCTDGLGNPITQIIPEANAWYSVGVPVLVVIAALLTWAAERSARNRDSRSVIGSVSGLALVALLAAIALGFYQFQTLPFLTIDGAYASTYEFFMGSTLVHVILLAFIVFGLWNRARRGRYDDGRWYQVRLIRFFALWIAISACLLTVVSTFFG
jgi:heme/copper-type cytochrome/quinol oxidase subunit 3